MSLMSLIKRFKKVKMLLRNMLWGEESYIEIECISSFFCNG